MIRKFRLQIHTAKVLTRREFLLIVKGLGLYMAISGSMLMSSFFLKNYLQQIEKDNILVSSDPLHFPLYIAIFVVSSYLALLSTISISRERDQGTLEVLFYGPVNSLTYLTSKYMANMLVYLVMSLFLFTYFCFVQFFTNLVISRGLLLGILLSLFMISCIVAFSLFISSMTSKMKNSITWLVGMLSILVGIQISHEILLRFNEEDLSPLVLYLRETLHILVECVQWISPLTPLYKGIEAISIGSLSLYSTSIFHAIIYSVLFIAFSVIALEKNGVRS